jgi:radical SAM superfamily enzyme YgiQ (UPF0313 family)
MRILLVKPQAQLRAVLGLQAFSLLEPLELGYLAAAVSPEHEVKVLDLRLVRKAERAFVKTLQTLRPDLVGLTGYTHEGSSVKKLAGIARRTLPTAKVVVGGHHATVAPRDYNIPEIDAIVRGAGCAPFSALVEAFARGEDPRGTASTLFPGKGFDEAAADEWPMFPDPRTMPRPRRDVYDWRGYRSVWTGEEMPAWYPLFPPVAMVRASWGCRMRCSFCIVPFLCGGEHQPRPAEDVADEIAGLPQQHVYFADDENFIDEDFAWRLADALAARGVAKRYFAWARSTTVNRSPELFRRWREIGLDAAFIGFEFTTDRELKQVLKGGSVAANERALDCLRSLGIAVHAGFMVRPEYSIEEFRRLREYVQSLPPVQCSFTVCTPSPGTPDYEQLEPHIWAPNPYDLHDCMHPLTPTAIPLKRFAALFAELASVGTAKTPLRSKNRPIRPLDLARVLRAEYAYNRGYRLMYQDYPRALWGGGGGGTS